MSANLNKQPDIEIFTTVNCPYCWAAKELLERKSLTYKEIKVDNRPDLREKLQNLSGSHTVPQIWIANVHIGGFTELDACENSGRLDRLLSK